MRSTGPDAEPAIAVVVPTRDRPGSLRRCLAALRAQTAPVRIVVVDDGSTAAREVAAAAGAAGALLVRRGGEGPAAARNAGARESRAAAVCFTDDDCEPAPGWAQALAAPILAGEAGAAAGETVVEADAGAADRAWQAIVGYLQRQAAARGSASPGFAPTANLACSRRLWEELPFEESFPAAAGEDRDWADRAARRGMAPRFVPAAVVVHRPGLGIRTFLRQQYGYGRGAARYRDAAAGRGIGSPAFYAGLLRSGFAAGADAGLLVCAAQAATAAGVARERLGRRSG
jgi:GT2 family glycosyltransferase